MGLMRYWDAVPKPKKKDPIVFEPFTCYYIKTIRSTVHHIARFTMTKIVWRRYIHMDSNKAINMFYIVGSPNNVALCKYALENIIGFMERACKEKHKSHAKLARVSRIKGERVRDVRVEMRAAFIEMMVSLHEIFSAQNPELDKKLKSLRRYEKKLVIAATNKYQIPPKRKTGTQEGFEEEPPIKRFHSFQPNKIITPWGPKNWSNTLNSPKKRLRLSRSVPYRVMVQKPML